jgi:hypothetical protein
MAKTSQFKKSIQYIINIVLIITFIVLIDKIGLIYSSLAYLMMFGAFFCYKLYQQRTLLMLNVRTVEAGIFGKPLDRDAWAPGEIKKKKIKVVWGRHNDKAKISRSK